MKSITNFLTEAVRVGKAGKPTIDIKNFDTILKNLRKDNENYIGVVGELTEDIEIDSVENTDIWGHLDAPVNKIFDRQSPKAINLKNRDQLILIYDLINPNQNNIKNLYICKYEDVWYYLNRDDADEFMKYIKVIKEDRP